MATRLASSTPTHYTAEIPPEVYQPLVQIAKYGFYDAEDIKHWYRLVVSQLFHTESIHAHAIYPVTTSDSNSGTVIASLEGTVNRSGETSAIEPNAGSHGFYENSRTSADLWPDSFSFEPLANAQLPITTALSEPPTYVSANNVSVELSPCWSPKNTSYPAIKGSDLSASVNGSRHYTTEAKTPPQWSYSESYEDPGSSSRKRKASQSPPYQSPPYQMAMSSTAMPLLIPTTENSPPMQNSVFAPISEITYLPPISIIPARKRRKAAGKGVKKFIQPLHVSRESI